MAKINPLIEQRVKWGKQMSNMNTLTANQIDVNTAMDVAVDASKYAIDYYNDFVDAGAPPAQAKRYAQGMAVAYAKGFRVGATGEPLPKAHTPRRKAVIGVDARGFTDQTTLADALCVPTRDYSGDQRSIPYLLRDAGLVKGRRLTALGKKYGEARPTVSSHRNYWHMERTVTYLTNWMWENGWAEIDFH